MALNDSRRVRGLLAAEVVSFLREHASFLADHPELYRRLAPPVRVHGDIMADHMAAMLRAERRHAAAMAERADGVLAAGRAAAGLAARVQDAVLALIVTTDVSECIAAELPAILALDAVSLLSEGLCEGRLAGARAVPVGTVARLLGNRPAAIRRVVTDAALLHAEAAPLARHDALVRVPRTGPKLMLALVARDGDALDPAQSTGALGFLGRAVAAALARVA